MYRASGSTPRCNSCGNTNLTPPTSFESGGDSWAKVAFLDTEATPGFFASGHAAFPILRARVCLDCGNVMLALDEQQLSALRASSAHLQATDKR